METIFEAFSLNEIELMIRKESDPAILEDWYLKTLKKWYKRDDLPPSVNATSLFILQMFTCQRIREVKSIGTLMP